ncbi:AMIN-like domain-containing (lipo)protein [Haloechinothrix salitolerans]|uniref:AMIN-like domain-containing protein n=1 Tax=Haloechinothrix salitolerans TaxID=926830 RepID=A0ABW2BUI5_9PSEU
MRTTTRIAGTLVMLVALVAAGCTDGQPVAGDATGTTSPTTTAITDATATSEPETTRTDEPATTTTERTGPSCRRVSTWDFRPDREPGSSRDRLFQARIGQHKCFDRVVFDIDGTNKPGALVRYVDVVRADGSGEPYPVAGDAALEVIVRASISGYPESTGTFGRPGNRLYTADELRDWRTLREVRFAGFFEGQSTIALGVRENLPFRAFTLVDADAGISKLVVDIAHSS